MHELAPPNTEHRICFQAFITSHELSEFLLSNRLQRVQAMLPNLSQVRVIIQGPVTVKPHHVTSLACLLEEYRQKGIAILFEEEDAIISAYLRSIDFFNRWGTTEQAEVSSFLLPTDSTSYILWKAEPEAMNAYVNGAYQHYHNSFFVGKDLSFLPTYLAELFNNVFDHAFTSTNRVAFGMVQYYPSRKRLFIAVSDFGMGIAKTVNQFLIKSGQEPVTASEALQKALALHFTSRSRPHNQGRGLDTLRTGILQLRGTLTLQTSRVIYHVSKDGTEIFNKQAEVDYPGTTALIRIFYDNLQPEETDILEDDIALF
jgi:hypothetical protein